MSSALMSLATIIGVAGAIGSFFSGLGVDNKVIIQNIIIYISIILLASLWLRRRLK